MQDRAIENIQKMLKRRNLNTTTERITTDELTDVNLYTIGDTLVIFSIKPKGIIDRDVTRFLQFAERLGTKSGIIIVSLTEPSKNVLKVVKSHAKNNVQYYWIQELQFDWSTHWMYIPHLIWNEETRNKYPLYAAFYDKLNIQQPEEELPYIDSNEYPIKNIGAKPGDIILVLRPSDTSGVVPFWRYCVEDTSI